MTSEPANPAVPHRRWVYLALGVVAVAAGTTLAVVADDGATETSTATTGPTTSTTVVAATTSTPTTTTTPPTDPDVDALVGHRWVRLSGGPDLSSIDSELTLEFGPDGTVRGFDGCTEWSTLLDVGALGVGRVQFASGIPPDSSCSTGQTDSLVAADLTVATADDGLLLTVAPPGRVAPVEYVAVDSLEPLDSAGLVGSWQQPGQARLTFFDDHTLQVSGCSDRDRWTLNGNTLWTHMEFADRALLLACAGTSTDWSPDTFGGNFLARMAWMPLDCGLYGFRGEMLTACTEPAFGPNDTASSGLRWLRRAPEVEPAFDLVRFTAFGFASGTRMPITMAIDEISLLAGEPSFDSGWYTAPNSETTDYEDCFGGRQMRIVRWGDVSLGWLQLNTDPEPTDLLWLIAAGGTSAFREFMRYDGTLPAPADGSPSTTPAIGSTIDEFAAAGLRLTAFNNDAGASTTPETATTANVSGASSGYSWATLDRGTVTGLLVTNPGFC